MELEEDWKSKYDALRERSKAFAYEKNAEKTQLEEQLRILKERSKETIFSLKNEITQKDEKLAAFMVKSREVVTNLRNQLASVEKMNEKSPMSEPENENRGVQYQLNSIDIDQNERNEIERLKEELEKVKDDLRQSQEELSRAVNSQALTLQRVEEERNKSQRLEAELFESKRKAEELETSTANLQAAILDANLAAQERMNRAREEGELLVHELRTALEFSDNELTKMRDIAEKMKKKNHQLENQCAQLLMERESELERVDLLHVEVQETKSELQRAQIGIKHKEEAEKRVLSLTEDLLKEKSNSEERRLKMRLYAEALINEKNSLSNTLKQVQASLNASIERESQARKAADQSEISLREMQISAAQWETEAELLREQINAKTSNGGHNTASLESALEEKKREVEEHRVKRLAARSEVLAMSRALEAEREGLKYINSTIQLNLIPKAYSQAARLEGLVQLLDIILGHFSRSSGVKLATKLQTAKSTFHKFRGTTKEKRETGLELVDVESNADFLTPYSASSRSSDTSIRNGFNDIIERHMERTNKLEKEMEKVAAGITLASQSTNQLYSLMINQVGLCSFFSSACCIGKSRNSYSTLETQEAITNGDGDST